MFLQRQIASWLATGNHPRMAEATVFPWRARDVRATLALVLGDGKVAGDSIRLDNGDSFLVPLPNAYDSSNPLFAIIRASSIGKCVTVSPAHATSTVLIKGTDSDAAGAYPGFLQWSGRVTSITLSNPQPSDPVLFDWLLFEVPDLDEASSFRGGNAAFGYVVDSP